MAGGTYRVHATGGGVADRTFGWLRHRHLLFHLVESDLRARYRRSYLGVAWAMIWPIVFSFIIATVAIHVFAMPVEVYVLYVITGFSVWELMSGAIVGGTGSLQQAEGYLRQTRLPYILFPLRTVSSLMVNAFFYSVAAALMIVIFDPEAIGVTWLLWPVVLAMAFVFSVPLCLISAMANLKFRDYQHAIGLVMFLLWYLSPNIVVREVFERPGLKTFTDLNPFTSVLDMLRDVALYGAVPNVHDLMIWGAYTALAWIVALLWLRAEGRNLIYYM